MATTRGGTRCSPSSARSCSTCAVHEKGYRNALYASTATRGLGVVQQHGFVLQPDLLQALLEADAAAAGVREHEAAPLPYLALVPHRDGGRQGRARVRPADRLPRGCGGRDASCPCCCRCSTGRGRSTRSSPMLGEPARPAVENVLAELDDHGLARRGAAATRTTCRGRSRAQWSCSPSLRPGTRVVDTAAALGSCSVACRRGRLRRSGGGSAPPRSAASGVERLGRPDRRRPRRLRSVRRASSRACGSGTSRHSRPRALAAGPALRRALRVGRPALPAGRHRAVTSASGSGGVANLDGGDELALLDARSRVPIRRRRRSTRCSAAVAAQCSLSSWLVLGDHYAPGAFYALELLPTLASHASTTCTGCPAVPRARGSPTSPRRCRGTRRCRLPPVC